MSTEPPSAADESSEFPRVYTLNEFYADHRRTTSGTVVFGEHWRDGSPGDWRIEWLDATGELTAFYNPPAEVTYSVGFLLEIVAKLFRSRSKPEVAVLLVEGRVERVRELLRDWERHVDTDDGLDWLWERVRGSRPGK